jgi:hypothetical protein
MRGLKSSTRMEKAGVVRDPTVEYEAKPQKNN